LAYRRVEVARRLGVAPTTLHDWVHTGKLETVKVGRVVLITPAAIEKFLKTNARPARED